MNERMSAFLDGELPEDECGQALGRLRSDDKLRRDWDTYHLIGDILRGDSRRSYLEAVQAQLASEPALIAASRPAARRGTRFSAFFLPAAAGAAAVVLVGWLALPMLSSGPEVARSVVPPAVPAVDVAAPAQIPKDVEEYLLAHQRFSPSGVIQGLARDIRQVSADNAGAPR